jgi:peptidyl-tRNA hydrolase, PTH1 family
VEGWLKQNTVDFMVIIHDDLELPLGEMKRKETGSAAGHNGVRSIHLTLGTQDIPRLRIGIGRPPEGKAVDQYVLESFSSEEEESISQNVIPKALQALDDIVTARLSPE